ncbi:YccF domain-containing protein [Prevotella sp. MA2016]|nr:YccF domain-containing protein [Prevotella sp. MA2016]
MKTLGNIIWIVFGGLHIALEYFIAGLILLGLRGASKTSTTRR